MFLGAVSGESQPPTHVDGVLWLLLEENGHPASPGRRSFACVIFLFVTKGKFHIPRNSPQKEKMTHASQPTPRRMS